MTSRQWAVLGLLCAAGFFDQYDVALMTLALSQIQADLLISEENVAQYTAIARFGQVMAFPLTVLADRIGRRRLLLLTIVGFTLTTFATAFVRTPAEYVLCQFFARIFIGAEMMLAVVVITEEITDEARGWGIGMLGAVSALGYGLAAIIFGWIDVLPYGWRALYAFGAMPLVLIAWFRRTLPETRRFEAHRTQRLQSEVAGGLRAALQPVLSLVRSYPLRMLALAAALVPYEFVAWTAFAFMAKTLQEVHDYAPGEVTLLFIVAGSVGILGNIVAGSLGDRFGRRRVMAALLVMYGGSVLAFYNTSGWLLPPAWILLIFGATGSGVLFQALGSELFPTSHRSTASGMRVVIATCAGVGGLWVEGWIYPLAGSHQAAITWMTPMLLLPPLMVLLFLPETARRELEEISPERA